MALAENSEFLVDAQWIVAHRANVILIDTRPPADYWTGHLDGALNFDPFPFHHSDTSEAGLRNFRGQLAWIFSALGIGGNETVVFYENDSGMRATRGAWALEYMGHPAVRILDGGLKLASSEKLVTNARPVIAANFQEAPREDAIASRDYILERIGRGDAQIFDVRTDEEYFGERVRARHGGAIPGAIHRDWTHNVGPDG